MPEDYHTGSQFQAQQAARPRLYLVKPAPAPFGALGSPRIASSCLMCGGGFTEKDLTELEWPVIDHPAHRICYLEHVEASNQFSDMLEGMRGA